jgi:hypothetical protein
VICCTNVEVTFRNSLHFGHQVYLDVSRPHIALPVKQFLAEHKLPPSLSPQTLHTADYFLFPTLKRREFRKMTLKILSTICTVDPKSVLRPVEVISKNSKRVCPLTLVLIVFYFADFGPFSTFCKMPKYSYKCHISNFAFNNSLFY